MENNQNALEWVTTDELIKELATRTDYIVLAYQLKGDPDEMMKTQRFGHRVACLGASRLLFKDTERWLCDEDVYFELDDDEEDED